MSGRDSAGPLAPRPERPGRSGGLAVVTMVRDDDYFLTVWASYWRRYVPPSSLFVILDGAHASLPEACAGCQVITLPAVAPYSGFNQDRWDFMSAFASSLTTRFERVLAGDVDELVVLDPAVGDDPVAYILARTEPVVSPFALEIIHRFDLEDALDPAEPILAQRAYARINGSYCKPCIIDVPVRWSAGGHYSDHPELHLDRGLFLLHLRYIDRAMLRARQARRAAHVATGGRDAAGRGWTRSVEAVDAFLQSFQDKGAPIDTDFAFDWQRKRIESGVGFDAEAGVLRRRRLHNLRTYRIPGRFAGLF